MLIEHFGQMVSTPCSRALIDFLKVVLIGPNWPDGGEIDIVEGVNDYTNNQATIHTDVGCTLASSSSTVLGISGNVVGGTDCAALTTGNQGCGIRASTNNSFGVGFNANGGGVYASMLTEYLTCLFILIIFFFSEMGYDRCCCLFFSSWFCACRHQCGRS